MPILGYRMITSAILLVGATFDLNAAETKGKLTKEYDLKAAFLLNFAQFVEWPSEAFTNAYTPFVIGVLGADPFGKGLDEIAANELVHGHEIVIRRYSAVEEIKDCHILYVSSSETERLDRIFESLHGKSILTVGEAEHFAVRDGIIRFLVVGNKLRLRINVQAANEAKLTISSQLLRQAEIADARQLP